MQEVSLCNFVSPTIPLLLSHLRSVHASDPQFHVVCGIGGCTVSSRSFSALYSHILYRHHPNVGIVKKRASAVMSLQRQSPCTNDTLLSEESMDFGDPTNNNPGIFYAGYYI